MKQNLSRIVICLLSFLIPSTVLLLAYAKYDSGQGGFRLGVDLVGGSILVYEVDSKKTEPNTTVNIEELAASLKRRIDPADLFNITIRPIQGNPPRVEIILPTGGQKQSEAEEKSWQTILETVRKEFPGKEGSNYQTVPRGDIMRLIARVEDAYPDTEKESVSKSIRDRFLQNKEKRSLTTEEVERIKDLIAQQGRLEFRILANRLDDEEAIAAAEKYLREPANQVRLKKLARDGDAPPAPMTDNGTATFNASINGDRAQYSYSWIEVGKEELYSLGLNSSAETDPVRSGSFKQVASTRDKEATTAPGTNSCLIYSRTIPNPERLMPKDRESEKKYEYFLLTRNTEKGKEITGDFLSSARRGMDSKGDLTVDFRFSAEGGNRFYELTNRNRPASKDGFKRHLAIVLDGQIRSAPVLNQAIRTDGQISGSFTPADIDTLVRILRAGALPATLKPQPVSENTVGATLGDDTIKAGTYSIIFAFLAVIVFMVVYYRLSGLVACIALLSNLLLTVAFMVIVKATFTLPGLAGLVLTLGMAVDANILIYERLREEREKGASILLALRNGYDRAFPTIIDTHMSSIFTAVILYVVGNDQLRGFGISLTLGLIISLFTSLFMTRTIFDVCQLKGWIGDLKMLHVFVNPNFDFMAIRRAMFSITLSLTVIGGGLFIYRLDKGLNIDFVGGTAYSGQLTSMQDISWLRGKFAKTTLPEISIEQIFLPNPEISLGNKSKFFTIRTTERIAATVLEEVNNIVGSDLQRVQLSKYSVDKNGMNASLEFDSYASRAQITNILRQEFEKKNLTTLARQMRLDPAGEQKDGRFNKMTLELPEPASVTALEETLKSVQSEFNSKAQPERLENFDPQLASSTQQRALYAIVASWAAIVFYLWFRFGNWTFGLAALLCLIHDLFFTLGAIALCHYLHGSFFGNFFMLQEFKIDLPAVAALLTLVGYSVNDTIVVFDRIREVRGKNPTLSFQMINDSVNQTLSRTVLTSFVTWLVVLVLYIWGGEGVHLFAFVMVIGVIVGTYSSIYIASPLLLIFGEGIEKRKFKALGSRAAESNA
ncbi:MAG: protein translocase subunit SecD [Planctomycetota bacterium]|nr:protein translocase subunit SecD [Planctomycetota bacterium]